jgi:Flp pilus assembly CpaE family ATPase
MRKSFVLHGSGDTEASGPLYAILPAHSNSGADSVARELSRELSQGYQLSVLLADFCAHDLPIWGTPEAPQRLDSQMWDSFLTRASASGQPVDTLDAREAHPRHIPRLLDYARRRYDVTCADLSGAKESSALEVLRQADGIFLVAGNSKDSIRLAHYRAAWLQSMKLEDRTGLLLDRAAGGADGAEAEERTGLPVCAAVGSSREIEYLAAWLAAPLVREQDEPLRRAG